MLARKILLVYYNIPLGLNLDDYDIYIFFKTAIHNIFLLISTILQSCRTPPNSPPLAKKEEAITHLSIPIEQLTDKQLLPKDSPLSIVPQLQATETEQRDAVQVRQTFSDLAAAQASGQDKACKTAKAYYPKVKAGVQNIDISTYKMGRLYERGKGVEEDLDLALMLYTKASRLGHLKATYRAGRLHLFGRTPRSDIREAYGLLEKAGQEGIYKACLLLGRVHEYGWGIMPDPIEALSWYVQASLSLNNDNYSRGVALYHLGWLYKLGRGVACNEATALSFFEQALIIGQGTRLNRTSDQYSQQVENRIKKQTQEQLIQVLTEISHNGDVIVKELEKANAHLELDDKADLALLVHHPLFQINCKSVHLLKQIGNVELIVDFVKHLKGTNVNVINLKETEMGDAEVVEFSKYLKGTNVDTIKLEENEITSTGAIGLFKHLQGTQVHIIDLGWNKINDQGLMKVAKNLQGTDIHMISLAKNGIEDQVAINFASHLQGTKLHTVDLSENLITSDGQARLKKEYDRITWLF
jgi:TPR repeat protein